MYLISKIMTGLSCAMALQAIAGQCALAEINNIFLKNNGISPADIWVNDSYQGYVPGGELCFIDHLGFDKDRTGTVPQHGGFEGTGDVTVRICQCRQGKPFKTELKVPKEWGSNPGDADNSDPRVWFGETSAGRPLTKDDIPSEIRPIYYAREYDDCGGATQQGVAETNAKKTLNFAGTWIRQTGNFYGWVCNNDGQVFDLLSGPLVGTWAVDQGLVTISLNTGLKWTGKWAGKDSVELTTNVGSKTGIFVRNSD